MHLLVDLLFRLVIDEHLADVGPRVEWATCRILEAGLDDLCALLDSGRFGLDAQHVGDFGHLIPVVLDVGHAIPRCQVVAALLHGTRTRLCAQVWLVTISSVGKIRHLPKLWLAQRHVPLDLIDVFAAEFLVV